MRKNMKNLSPIPNSKRPGSDARRLAQRENTNESPRRSQPTFKEILFFVLPRESLARRFLKMASARRETGIQAIGKPFDANDKFLFSIFLQSEAKSSYFSFRCMSGVQLLASLVVVVGALVLGDSGAQSTPAQQTAKLNKYAALATGASNILFAVVSFFCITEDAMKDEKLLSILGFTFYGLSAALALGARM